MNVRTRIFGHHRLLQLKLAVSFFICLLFQACTSGKVSSPHFIYNSDADRMEIAIGTEKSAATCNNEFPDPPNDSLNRKNTLFVHPGLLLSGLDWDQGLAAEAGKILVKQHFARSTVILSDRKTGPIFDHAIKDPGTEFVGIHYSMGGQSDILRGSLDATKQASRKRGVPLHYHALLFDPFSISDIADKININEPELGYLFFLISSENSFLRPNVIDLPKSFINSEKVIFIYAEDFHENWNHFGMLTAFSNQNSGIRDNEDGRKMNALFRQIFAMALGYQQTPSWKQGCRQGALSTGTGRLG